MENNVKNQWFTAINRGDFRKVSEFLQQDNIVQHIDMKDEHGFTALMIASEHGTKKYIPIVRLLLEKGADIYQINDQTEQTPLLLALSNKRKEIIQMLLEKEAEWIQAGRFQCVNFVQASSKGYKPVVDFLLQHGADPNIPFMDSFALMQASKKGHGTIVHALLEAGAEPNVRDSNGNTPLIITAKHNSQLVIIERLLKKNADPNLQNNDGLTALMAACEHTNSRMADILLQKGANPNLIRSDGNTALLIVVMTDTIYTIYTLKVLLKRKGRAKTDLDSQNRIGLTALMITFWQGRDNMATLLLDHGANMNKQNEEGVTALMLACLKGHAHMVTLLLERGANMNIADANGNTALIWASRRGNINIVLSLLEHGALSPDNFDINKQNQKGETALIIAAQKSHLEIFNILMENVQRLRISYDI